MTYRDRILAAMRGENNGLIPWAPRMDLWLIANREKGTLPKEFAHINSTVEIAETLNVACHAIRGDFTHLRTPEHLMLRGLGLDLHYDYPFRVKVTGLRTKYHSDKENFITAIHTPVGDVRTHTILTDEMLYNGISYPFIKSYAIESKVDFEAVGHVFEHLEVVPTPEAFARFQQRVGNHGVAIAAGLYAASPMHLILHDLMPMEQFFISYLEDRSSLKNLAKRIEPFFEAVLDAVLQCDAEVIHWGSNYDQNITWPPFFKDEIVPWLQKVSRRTHDAGKLLLTHTDGENKALLNFYPSCKFDVAESVCPKPMTSCTLKEIRDALSPHIAVWGGIPAVSLLDNHMDDVTFENYLNQMFNELGSGKNLILGVSDNVPPEANLSRLKLIENYIMRETFENR